jgi:transposase InsO family protein
VIEKHRICRNASPGYPGGMGALIRLCLINGIELWFIPRGEPWRNGVVEKFNDHNNNYITKDPEACDQSETCQL